MNKRKIDVNEIKKSIVKGKKYKNIDVKYEVVLSYFKQKQVKQMQIFQVTFFPLIQDILTQLLTAQIVFKLQQQSKQPIKPIIIGQQNAKLDVFYLKGLSKQYPIQQICQCLYIQKDKKHDKKVLSIQKNKLMTFFKKLRLIYTDFCYCVGQKCILQALQIRNFYEVFKTQWSKRQQKGRLCEKGKLQKRLCRSLFFLGVLIENNIYEAIQTAQRKKRQQTDDLGTKSQKKKNIKGIVQNQSSTYSFGSADLMSNFSLRLKSQKSNQDDFFLRDYYHKNPYSQYSQKSQKIISKSKFGLINKVQIQNLQFKLKRVAKQIQQDENNRFQINYLSNDVENILIQQAFKIQKFKDSCQKNQMYPANPYYYMNYMNYYQPYDYTQNIHSQNSFGSGYNIYADTLSNTFTGNMNTNNYHSYFQFNNNLNSSNNSSSYLGNNVIYEEGDQVNQLRRSFDCYNLVQTRKNPHRFTAKKNNK